MEGSDKPKALPLRPQFSSGPCIKRPGWSIDQIQKYLLIGRSHRAKEPNHQLFRIIQLVKELLQIPEDYLVGIVPASNTGAYEMLMWNLLGAKPIDVFAWEHFGRQWVENATKYLNLKNTRIISSEYGRIPDLSVARMDGDICFTWNGTTSGARVPNAEWVCENRNGLTLCDATSAIFAQNLDWTKLDATTFSWQKVMGGEASHGIIVLSPRAIERLESFRPNRPLPKIFRLVNDGRLIEGIFRGETINTPSMLCVADALDALSWIKRIGGLKKTIERSEKNFSLLQNWLDKQAWIENVVKVEELRSNTSVCLEIVSEEIQGLSLDKKWSFIRKMVSLLETEKAAFDICGHRSSPPGLRIWCGATVERSDIEALLPWLNWAYEKVLKI